MPVSLYFSCVLTYERRCDSDRVSNSHKSIQQVSFVVLFSILKGIRLCFGVRFTGTIYLHVIVIGSIFLQSTLFNEFKTNDLHFT